VVPQPLVPWAPTLLPVLTLWALPMLIWPPQATWVLKQVLMPHLMPLPLMLAPSLQLPL
jgi:hypothetical protein